MRQTHTPGERLFIDYAGQTVGVTEGTTGEIREAQVFVAVLGASNYTYLEATWSQQLPNWIGSHVRALEFFGGCTELWVPDNLRSGVSKSSRYEPDVNPTYHDLAEHYGVAVSRRAPAAARTMLMSRTAYSWSRAGCWRGCGRSASSASMSPTGRCAPCWPT
jgi:transposase